MGRLDEDSVFGFSPHGMPAVHELGEPLDGLSTEELGERLSILQSEIGRLEAARAAKVVTRRAADACFKL